MWPVRAGEWPWARGGRGRWRPWSWGWRGRKGCGRGRWRHWSWGWRGRKGCGRWRGHGRERLRNLLVHQALDLLGRRSARRQGGQAGGQEQGPNVPGGPHRLAALPGGVMNNVIPTSRYAVSGRRLQRCRFESIRLLLQNPRIATKTLTSNAGRILAGARSTWARCRYAAKVATSPPNGCRRIPAQCDRSSCVISLLAGRPISGHSASFFRRWRPEGARPLKMKGRTIGCRN